MTHLRKECVLQHCPPITVRPSLLKLLGLLLAALTMTLLSLWMLSLEPQTIINGARWRSPLLVHAVGLAGLLLFGAATLAVPVALWRGRHGLRLDGHGLHNHTWGVLPWADIRAVATQQHAGQTFLVIHLQHPERHLACAGQLRRHFLRMNQKRTGSPLVLGNNALNIGLDELHRLIEKYRHCVTSTVLPGTANDGLSSGPHFTHGPSPSALARPRAAAAAIRQGIAHMEQKHSGLGIASFVLSITSSLLLFVMFVVAGVMELSTPGGIDEDSPQAIVLGLTIILCVIGEMIALGLGIAALCQSDRKKIFGILGVVFSSTTALATIVLIALGS